MKPASPHIKRRLSELLAQWPTDRPLQLIGPMGVGKRTLQQKLAPKVVQVSHVRAPTEPAHQITHPPIRLHPLTVRELGLHQRSQLMTLMARGGFPETIWRQSETEMGTSMPNHLRGLMVDLWGAEPRQSDQADQANQTSRGAPTKTPNDPAAFLATLMASVGQPLSIHALATFWGVSDATMRRWIDQLEAHHALFRLKPLACPPEGPKFRPIKKDQKAYPYDWSQAPTNLARLEALVAGHLLHWVEAQVDLFDRQLGLHYFRDCDQREIDFVVCENQVPILLAQCEPAITRPSSDLVYLQKKFPQAQAWHLSLEHAKPPQKIGAAYMAHPLDFLKGLEVAHSQRMPSEVIRMNH